MRSGSTPRSPASPSSRTCWRPRPSRARCRGGRPPPTSSSGGPKADPYSSSATAAGRPEPAAPEAMSQPLEIKDHSLPRLREAFAQRGLAPFRAEQLGGWIYREGIEDPERMTNLPAELRSELGGSLALRALEL